MIKFNNILLLLLSNVKNIVLKIDKILQLYQSNSKIRKGILSLIKENRSIFLKGLVGSSRNICLTALCSNLGRNVMIVENDEESAGYLYSDFSQFIKDDRLFYYPSSFKKSIKFGKIDSANIILRSRAINALRAQNSNIVITYPEALLEKVNNPEDINQKTLSLSTNDTISLQTLKQTLITFGFKKVDYVYEPGHFAIRGSIIDIYSWTSDLPYRLDFFGNDIESIRTFNIENQLSIEKVESMNIMPSSHSTENQEVIFTKHLKSNAILGFNNYDYVCEKIKDVLKDESEEEKAEIKKDSINIITLKEFKDVANSLSWIEFGRRPYREDSEKLFFNTSPQDVFHKNFDLISSKLQKYQENGYKLNILSDSSKQLKRLKDIFSDRGDLINFTAVDKTLHEGFVDHEIKIVCFTDHQIFERYHKYNLNIKNTRNGKLAMTLKELMQFQFGDYITHIDYGVGRFGGLFRTEINGKIQEVIKINYQDNDTLFVNIHNLHKISKYKGKDAIPPKIYKLGGSAWTNVKEKTKKKVKDIARNLISLYAKRKEEQGFQYSPDSFMQKELEASFPYDDTPDQLKAAEDVKQDMEKSKPMDRLVCGDVGFGKTEVAIRAAFKACADDKQVAILVPTTVLAFQHYKTFKKRLKDFPCKVEYISRTRTAKEITQIKKELLSGEINIIIGTQKLLGKTIKFNDLGLLIVDEEQKFGVGVKEKLRELKANVDTLTLTATPIPRTLQFSLMGARDLSIISTPPPNRIPIQTEVYTMNKDLLKNIVEYELNRNGQIFFINNRIQDLHRIEAMIQNIVPGVRTVVAHGQMNGNDMEKIILDFMDYAYDILICTTIVESGIDIPNANTIIVNNAQNYGLSDLHQLRGRVGRSNKKAFCYLFAPPMKNLSPESKRRLQAIENFSELGSGFNISMQDLDIRGAGNLLGSEQSGFIADLGYETYKKILNEAVQELKSNEFSTLYADETIKDKDGNKNYVSDCNVETDLDLMFPLDYIPGAPERINLYRELDKLETEDEIEAFKKKLEDRFGKMPDMANELIELVRLRRYAKHSGIEKIILKNDNMICYFVSNLKSSYYNSEKFGKIIEYASTNFRNTQLKENNNKRSLLIKNIKNIYSALAQLKNMQ